MDLRWRLNKTLVRAFAGCLKRSGLFDSWFGQWRCFYDDWERKGLAILPVHFYSPVPDTRSIPACFWNGRSEMVGVQVDLGKSLGLLRSFSKTLKCEYEQFPEEQCGPSPGLFLNNGAFLHVDAEILYCMVRHFRPKRIIEVGSGFSTLLICSAIRGCVKSPCLADI